jgi:hypothetical protein
MESFRHTCGQWVHQLALKMVRRKVIRQNPMETELKRVLTTLGIALFGVGQMAGGGPFVVAGTFATAFLGFLTDVWGEGQFLFAGAVAQMAGPAMVFSFLIAGLTAILSGLCFAEFASAIPRAGSGYLFTYVCLRKRTLLLHNLDLLHKFCKNRSIVMKARGTADNFQVPMSLIFQFLIFIEVRLSCR